jgi:hypothetical protein
MVKIGQEGSTAVTSSEEKAALAELGKAGQDQRSAVEFLPALWAETERDLARNPQWQPWRHSSEVPDDRHRKGGRVER